MSGEELVIQQTKKWISDVVVGCNFCPFAAKEVKQNSIHFQVETGTGLKTGLQAFLNECVRLDEHKDIETSFLIFTNAFAKFDDYLDLVSLAEKLLKQEGYEGVYQVASFHPLYCFAGAPADDAANYTNRSVFQMLHILREESIELALQRYPDPDRIPERNMHFAREKGVAYMKMLR
ncbi:MAG: DUF1415 domain-containing protein, partial [Flavitalea sp.]